MSHLSYTRSKFLENQVPQFLREEYPLFLEFLKQYYAFLDASVGELIAVKVTNPGKNYPDNCTVSFKIKDTNPESEFYNTYIADPKGAIATPIVSNGRINKIVVTNFGNGYLEEDEPIVQIENEGDGTEFASSVVIVKSVGNINQASKQIISARDIDEEYELLQSYVYNEFIPKIPSNKLYTTKEISVESSKFIKFIKQFYNSAGIEDSIKFLYRILFNTNVDFYYPKRDMLRVSDGKWNIDTKMRISTQYNFSDFNSYFVGHRILGTLSNSNAVIQSVNELTSPNIELVISNLKGSFIENEPILDFPISGASTQIGTSLLTDGSVLYKGTGSFLNDDGFPSSSKKIQDSYYYQDFSYELQSDQSIRSFKDILENLVHPAGLEYFIRINLVSETTDVNTEDDIEQELNVITFSEEEGLATLDINQDYLGPINSDLNYLKTFSYPRKYVDFSSSTTTYTTTTVKISDSNTFLFYGATGFNSEGYFSDFSMIITQGGNTWYRKITSFNPSSKTVTLDSATTVTLSSSIDYRIIQNRRIRGIDVVNRIIELDEKYFPFTSNFVSTLNSAITSSSGATGLFLNSSDFFNVKTGDILKIDSEDVLVNYISGSTGVGVYGLSVTRGYNSTSIASHTVGATAYNKTDHRYRDWRIYITSGPASGQYSKVTYYGATGTGGATGIIKYSSAYTLHASGATAPTTNSTYWLYPDFAGANNNGYYTSGATGISSLTIANRGFGATGATGGIIVTIDPPPYGTQAAATGVLGASGELSSITITNSGSGYLFPPNVSVTYVGGAPSGTFGYPLVYAELEDISATNSSQSYSYSEYNGVILSTSSLSNIFQQAKASCRLTPTLINSIVTIGTTNYVNIDTPLLRNITNEFVKISDGAGTTYWRNASGTKNDSKLVIDDITDLNTSYYVEGDGISYKNTIRDCTIIDAGLNYRNTPLIRFKNGGGSNAYAISELDIYGSLSSITLTNIGNNYTSAPELVIDPPDPIPGERISQTSTGARGTLDKLDKDNNRIYIIKDYNSPEFDDSDIICSGININITDVYGFYRTSGKQIDTISESEISVI